MENKSCNTVARRFLSLKRATFLVALFLCLGLSACETSKPVNPITAGYVSSFDLRHRFNLEVSPDLASRSFHFTGETNFSVLVGSSKIVLNGKSQILESAVVLRDGELYLPSGIINLIEKELNSKSVYTYVEKTFTYAPPSFVPVSRTPRKSTTPVKKPSHIVVLDPGHGGSDPGAIGPSTGITEERVNLAVSKKIRDLLKAKGYTVYLTRESNVGLTLNRRVQFAAEKNAEIFVSIHHNSCSSRSVKGFEAFYSSKNPFGSTRLKNSIRLAKDICRNLNGKWSTKNRGAKNKSLYVTRKTRMASVLVEVEFLSSRELEHLLKSDWFQNRAANGIAEGIFDYFAGR